MKNYVCSLDKLSKLVTIFVAAIIVVPVIAGYFIFLKTGDSPMTKVGMFLGPVLITVFMLFAYLLRPVSIEVTTSGLAIRRKIFSRTINFSDIKGISTADAADMKVVVRTFGNGGLFGYTGMYYNKKMGSMRWYCTQRNNYILIDTNNRKRIVVTPDEPEAFLNDIGSLNPALIQSASD